MRCPITEILYGGARGGGKTDGILGRIGLRAGTFGKHYNAIVFRREMPQADDMLERARELYDANSTHRITDSSFLFRNHARLRFRPLERLADAEKYQGQNLTDIVIEEAGNYPDPSVIMKLYGALRSAYGVPASLVMTGNPGGPGQHWLAERFQILRYPEGFRIFEDRLPTGAKVERVFIPARVQDNPLLLQNDPGYVDRLHLVGSEALVRAWLEGDWAAVEGAFFDCWSAARHTLPPAALPEHWLRFRSMDWGSARPSSIGWWAVASEDAQLGGRQVSRGTMIRYREWYVAKGPNEGLKLTAEQVAQGILDRTPEWEKIAYTVVDPAMFSEDGGPSLAERMGTSGVFCRRGDNRRVGRHGAIGGWDQVRQRLLGDDQGPKILAFTTCRDSIRTLPTLQHDPDKPEDLDTDSEDHAADDWRYACMSRPWTRPKLESYDPIAAMQQASTFEDYAGIDATEERRI